MTDQILEEMSPNIRTEQKLRNDGLYMPILETSNGDHQARFGPRFFFPVQTFIFYNIKTAE